MPRSPATVIIDGDIERRIISIWTPDFYKDNDQFVPTTDFVKASVSLLDYMLEKARGMPSLVNVDTCPPDILPFLAGLVGYEWKPTVSPEAQRQEIKKLVEVYLIRGTPQSVVRIVLNAGATTGSVFTPAEHIFTYDVSKWDEGDRYEDMDFWRWGTYEVIADKDFSYFHDDIESVHPAGTRWFGRQLIPLGNDNPGDPDSEVEQGTIVAHVYRDDYREPAGLQYDDSVLDDTPVGYWKLEEDAEVSFAAPGEGALYGTAEYGTAQYGGTAALLAIDSSPNGNHGVYNSETEIIAYGDAVRDVFGELQLLVKPVLPGSLRLTFDDKSAVDDGDGHITGAATATIDYLNGKIIDLDLDAPLGAGASSMPIISGSTTLSFFDSLVLRVEGNLVTGFADGAAVTGFSDSAPTPVAFTCPATYQPTYETNEVNGLPVLRCTNDAIRVSSGEINLGTNHLVVFAIKASAWHASNNAFVYADSASDSIEYDNSTGRMRYTVNGQTLTFPVRTLVTAEWYVLAIHRTGPAVDLYINGSYVGSGTLTTQAGASFHVKTICGEDATPTIGFQGDLATFLAYNNSFIGRRRREIMRYVGAKYNLFKGVAYNIDPTKIIGVDGLKVGKLTDETGALFTVGPDYDVTALAATRWQKGDSIVQGGETPIDQWPLSSSSGLGDLSQSSGALKPKFKANRLNGIGTVAFDGDDDVMTMLVSESYGTQQTISILMRLNDVATTQWLAGSSTTSHGIRYNAPVDGGPSISYVANGTTATWSFTFVAARWYLLQFHRNGTSNILYVDGVSQGSQAQGAGALSLTQVGTAGSGPGLKYFNGEIAEWISQAAAPTTLNTSDLCDALALKWAWMDPRRAATLQVNEINGQSTLRGFFDPTNDNGSALSLKTARNLHFGSTFSFVFRVDNFNRYVTDGDIMVLAGGKGSGTSRIAYNPAGLGSLIFSTDTASVSVTCKITAGVPHILTVRRRRAAVEFFLDGLSVGSANLTGGQEDSIFYFRTIMADSTIATEAGYNFDGDFAYGIVCDVALDDDEVMALHQYEATRFAVSYASPSSFPMRAFYNDYVQREIDGPIQGITARAGRFGLQPIVVNKGFIAIPGVGGLHPGSGSYTIEAWVRQSTSNGGTIFGTTWFSGSQLEIRLGVNHVDSKVEFSIKNGFKNYLLRSMESIGDEQWHHIVATIDATAKRLYLRVDFQLVDADDYDIIAALTPTTDYYIGALNPTAIDPLFYRGDISRVAVYQSALSRARVAVHFARGFGGMAVDDSIVTYIFDNSEPLGSFGVRAFQLDSSALDSPDEIDGEDVMSVITGESWRYVLNPAGATDRLAIRDRVQTDKNRIVDSLRIVDNVTVRATRRIVVVDLLGATDSATTGTA